MIARLAMLSCLYVVAIAGLVTVSLSQSGSFHSSDLSLQKTSRLSGPATQDIFQIERFG